MTKLPKTIQPSKVVWTPKGSIGVAPVTQPEHRSEFWYVATARDSGSWETKSVIRVITRNGQNLETEVKAWADGLWLVLSGLETNQRIHKMWGGTKFSSQFSLVYVVIQVHPSTKLILQLFVLHTTNNFYLEKATGLSSTGQVIESPRTNPEQDMAYHWRFVFPKFGDYCYPPHRRLRELRWFVRQTKKVVRNTQWSGSFSMRRIHVPKLELCHVWTCFATLSVVSLQLTSLAASHFIYDRFTTNCLKALTVMNVRFRLRAPTPIPETSRNIHNSIYNIDIFSYIRQICPILFHRIQNHLGV